MQLKYIFIALALAFCQLAGAQHNVTGTVKDDTGGPLPGATIKIKGGTSGTVSDNDGTFSLTAPEKSSVLLVSFLGFEAREIPLRGRTEVEVVLGDNPELLEEVVVVGYGTVRKSDLTGSVSTVEVEDRVARQSSTVDQLLQGRAAGVQVTQNGGTPGGGISVRIRGTNSLRGNNEPLYVIDGVIISSAGEDVAPAGGVGNSGQEAQNGLNGINPRDIENIEILKDASATAIYGSRGANGVVLITTKKGEGGKAKINAFVTTGFRDVTKKYDVLDGVDYARYRNEAALAVGNNVDYQIVGDQVFAINNDGGRRSVSARPADLRNWQDEVYQTGTNLNFGGSVSGGNDQGNYYLSAGYNDQHGIVNNSRFQSGDMRLNLNQKLNDNLQAEARFSAFYAGSDFAEAGDLVGGNSSFIRNLLNFNPVVTNEVDDDVEDLGNSNPYAWVNDFADISKEARYIGSLAFTYQLPLKGLSFQTKAGGNIRNKDRRRFYGLTTFQGANANGALQMSTLEIKAYQINNVLRFNRGFKGRHRINAIAGVTYDVRNSEGTIYAVEDFVTTQLTTQQPFLGQVITTPLSIQRADQQIFSVLGRINYTFNDKYTLTASVRRDGVSKFAPNQRYGTFPSFAAAWRAVDEAFISNLEVFSELKFRAGWGQIGNHGIGAYGTLSNYGSNPNILYGTPTNGTSVPVVLNNIANPELTWETTEQTNFGVDFGFFKNRFSGSVDYYDKTTKDLLQNIPIPESSGFSNLLINRGTINNRGVELTLQAVLVDSKKVDFSIGGNIAFNKTRIENLGIPLDLILVDDTYEQRSYYLGDNISRGSIFKHPANIFIEGEESGLFYGFESAGIYQAGDDLIGNAQVGDLRIVDQNGDGIIDNQDRKVIGNPNPDLCTA